VDRPDPSPRNLQTSVERFPDLRGGEMSGYLAWPEGTSPLPAVVVVQEWWGLDEHIKDVTRRLAREGYVALAPDLYRGQVASTIEEADRLSGAADEAEVNAIALAAVDHVADRLGPTAKLAALGFSFGAHWSMWSPAERDQLVASVLYYGSTGGPVLTRSSVPVLGHFAETDPYETEEGVVAFEATLRSAGRDVVIHRYPGTGHWFAEPSRDAYRAAAADLAFERTVAFLRRRLETPQAETPEGPGPAYAPGAR